MPPLAGCWSKYGSLRWLRAKATAGGGRLYYVLWGIGLLTAGLTAFYMFRLFFGIFAGGYRGSGPTEDALEEEEDEGVKHARHPRSDYDIYEAPAIMTVPMIILAVLAVIGGFVGLFSLIVVSSSHPPAPFLDPVF